MLYGSIRTSSYGLVAYGYPFDVLLSDAGAIIDRALQVEGVPSGRLQARVVDHPRPTNDGTLSPVLTALCGSNAS